MKTIRLGRGLELPAHAFATNVVAALGMRGSGKSNLMTVAVEGLLDAHIQVIILDYVGIHFGLRLLPNGRPSPYAIPVLGGRHGDIVLAAGAGRQVAEALAQSRSSAVLDISSFTKSDRIKFAADFGEAFFHAKKSHEGPVFLVLEEAQRFVPQVMRFSDPGLARCLGAFEEIAEVGRNYGIGLGLISQRPQKINKDVLNLAELLFAFQANGVLERRAIKEWVQEKSAPGRDNVADELPSLPRGTALVWSPSTFKLYGQYAFNKKTTYDAGATPERARASVTVKALDLKALEGVMAEIVEQGKTNDPRALRAEIERLKRASALPTELEREVRRLHGELEKAKAAKGPALDERQITRLERVLEKAGQAESVFGIAIGNATDNLQRHQQAVVEKLGELLHTIANPRVHPAPPARERTISPETRASLNRGIADAKAGRVQPAPAGLLDDKLPEKSQRMIGALKQGEAMGRNTMLFRSVAIIAGVSPNSGTTRNRKAQLTGQGYAVTHGDSIALTDKGRAYPVDVAMPPEDPHELLVFWKREIGTTKIAAMLEAVVLHGPCDDDALAAAAGMEKSGTFRNYKGALTGRGLIEKQHDGTYVAADVFLR